MIPTHGAVTSVFLLANAIRYEGHRDVDDWVHAAEARSSFLAAAIDHRPVAQALSEGGLVTSSNTILPSSRLRSVSERADRGTLLAIAAMLLEIDPPVWLRLAVIEGEVRHEVIPSADLDGLAWLEPDLDRILRNAVPSHASSTGVLALGIGQAAELVIVAALEAQDAAPIHVSEISDRFGYDIESVRPSLVRWEVKGCTELTADSFHLSRNEYEVGLRYQEEWVLVQVEFRAEALTAEELNSTHIASIRELRPAWLEAIVPLDSSHFSWETSARVTPPARAWNESKLAAPFHFRIPGLDTLGQEILTTREQQQRDIGGSLARY